LLFELGSRDEALRLSAQAVSRFSGNVAVLKGRGEILARSGKEYEAGVSLYEAHEAGADDPALLLAAGRHFRSAGEYDRAAKIFEELTERYAGKREAFEGRIEHAETLNDQDLAAPALDELEALAVDTEDPRDRTDALSALGRIYAQFGLEGAVKAVYEQIAAQATDPGKLAEAAIALIQSGSSDEGLAVAARVPLADLPGETAYALLMKQGEALSQRDPRLAADNMETAFSAYSKYRTEAGDVELLETNLRLGRSARARGIVADAQTRVASNELDPARLERLANTYGDFLYERADFRAAADAYGIATSAAGRSGADSADSDQQWASLQRANALFESGQYAEALPLLDEVASGTSSWRAVAKLRADAARIELRMRGAPAPKAEAQQAG
jgi:tetratricopeptide (TPR) repeat protein